MMFDTDIIIWVERGNKKAADLVDSAEERFISIMSYMELLQNANNKQQHSVIKDYLKEEEFIILPLSENIGHRALVYVEEYSLSHGISANDAVIAATAIENNQTFASSNSKHFRPIKDLKFKRFLP
jgi:predicted nucleic acid-binding protein